MGLDRFERANLNRLLACVAPIENRIARIKKKVKSDVEKASKQVEELEKQIEDYRALMQPLLDKENAASEPEEVEEAEDVQENNPIEFEEGEEIDVDNEEEFEEDPSYLREDSVGENSNIDNLF